MECVNKQVVKDAIWLKENIMDDIIRLVTKFVYHITLIILSGLSALFLYARFVQKPEPLKECVPTVVECSCLSSILPKTGTNYCTN